MDVPNQKDDLLLRLHLQRRLRLLPLPVPERRLVLSQPHLCAQRVDLALQLPLFPIGPAASTRRSNQNDGSALPLHTLHTQKKIKRTSALMRACSTSVAHLREDSKSFRTRCSSSSSAAGDDRTAPPPRFTTGEADMGVGAATGATAAAAVLAAVGSPGALATPSSCPMVAKRPVGMSMGCCECGFQERAKAMDEDEPAEVVRPPIKK